MDFGHQSGQPATTPEIQRLIRLGLPVTMENWLDSIFDPDNMPKGSDLEMYLLQTGIPWELDPKSEGPSSSEIVQDRRRRENDPTATDLDERAWQTRLYRQSRGRFGSLGKTAGRGSKG